jgi:SH3-like domain-containing protein
MKPNKSLGKIIGTTIGLALTGNLFITNPPVYAASNSTVLTSAEAQDIIANAEQIMGKVQYHFGVNDSSKLWFDCSSFTKYLYAQEGIQLRWGARLQYADGIKISRSELSPGDLVFFSTPATVNNTSTYDKIGHVGIYIGNGEVIHNISPQYDVKISSINSGWWNTHYIAAARVIAPVSAEPAPSNGGSAPSNGGPAPSNSSTSSTGTVVSSVAFLDSPSLKGTRIRYLHTGENFTIVNKVNPWWYQIKDQNGKAGYVTTLTKYVSVSSVPSSGSSAPSTSSTSSNNNTAPSKTGTVVSSVAFLDSPSLKGTRIRYLQKGETFTIVNKVNPWWYQIKDQNGKVGYVTTLTKYVSA